ncbi:SMC-Scp complex subunit ScpB (plasmid) [Gluconobacter sphaericus]|nr:SMC-Scp complex subunit ScpB [Gluconobacter sphaericus]
MLSIMTSSSLDPVRLAEALLFQSSGPVSRTMLARALGEEVEIAQIVSEVSRRTKGLGFELVAVGDGWMFRTAPDLAEPLRAVLEKPPERLPRAALEVLLLIAARQPVTRPEIESFRDATLPQKTLTLLQEKGLIRSVGRKPIPGQPQLWATTETFLVTYGLKSLTELDPLLEGLRGPL